MLTSIFAYELKKHGTDYIEITSEALVRAEQGNDLAKRYIEKVVKSS